MVGTQHQPLPVFLIYAVTCCLWTPMTPLTDAYALRGVARYGLNYGPLRLWGSAAFVVGALACGLLVDLIAAQHLIWVIAAVAGVGALASLGLQPLDSAKDRRRRTCTAPAPCCAIPAFSPSSSPSALIQGSHAAYYIFASITWQQSGLGGLTIAGLWALGVLAEIVRVRAVAALHAAAGAAGGDRRRSAPWRAGRSRRRSRRSRCSRSCNSRMA